MNNGYLSKNIKKQNIMNSSLTKETMGKQDKNLDREIIDLVGVQKLFVPLGGTIPPGKAKRVPVKKNNGKTGETAEVFKILNIENYPINTVRIFGEKNSLVYETEGYDNDNNVFKGKSQGNVDVPENMTLEEGIYHFVVQYMDSEVSKTTSGYLIINGE